MEDNSPERLDKSLTRLEMAHQLSETVGLILADVNKLVAYLASVDANGDGIVDELHIERRRQDQKTCDRYQVWNLKRA